MRKRLTCGADPIPGPMRDRMYEHGAGFLARLEFLSEVFVDGMPLSKPQFESNATTLADGVRAMRVHCPRFGPALLIEAAGRGRFITSELDADASILDLMA